MISLKRLSPSTENGTTAIDEVKAVCKHIVASHNDGAIADLVRRVIFNQSAVE